MPANYGSALRKAADRVIAIFAEMHRFGSREYCVHCCTSHAETTTAKQQKIVPKEAELLRVCGLLFFQPATHGNNG